MKLFQLHFRVRITLIALLAGISHAALAHTPAYPARPVKFLVPITPGGSNDVVARLIAQKLTEAWGQQIGRAHV